MVANTVASRKAKGRIFQQQCREEVIKLGINPNDILSTGMGQNGADLYLAEEARKLFPYGVECKNQETLNIWQALKQAEDNAKILDLTPVLFFKRSRSKAYAVVELDHFLSLVADSNSIKREFNEL